MIPEAQRPRRWFTARIVDAARRVYAGRPSPDNGLQCTIWAVCSGRFVVGAGGHPQPGRCHLQRGSTPEEITVEQLIDMRLQQLWDVSAEGVPEQTLATHTGATWGMLEGERLQLKLDIEEAIPTDDGRWQLLVPELTSLRLDQAIFGQVAEGQTQQSQEGMLEAQTGRFNHLPGRSMLRDLQML